MIEKFFSAVGPVALTAPGGTKGQAFVSSALGFKVKMVVSLTHPSQPTKKLEIKRVPNSTTLELGPVGASISAREDISLFPTGSLVFAPEQSRNPNIPIQEILRALYEEEPSVAWRTELVDPFGNLYTIKNPIPVRLSDGSINIGSVDANLEVQLTAKDNDPTAGEIHDSVRIGDGSNELSVNADGSINVKVDSIPTINAEIVSKYSEVSSVASGVLTSVNSYTVPLGKTANLQRVFVNGDNIADYTVLLNAVVIDRARTYFGGPLNAYFEFTGYPKGGLPLVASDSVVVKVVHQRPALGSFGARIQVEEVG